MSTGRLGTDRSTTDRLTAVLDATYECLSRYGVRRTTMDDIAGACGMSRSAVYLYVRNRDDAFRRLAVRLHDVALDRAQRAAAADGPLVDRILGVLAAKLEMVTDLTGQSPHAAELLDEKARLFGDICQRFSLDIRGLLIDLLAQAAPLRVSPDDAAGICIALVIGLESSPDARRLLPPATSALINGLRADTPTN